MEEWHNKTQNKKQKRIDDDDDGEGGVMMGSLGSDQSKPSLRILLRPSPSIISALILKLPKLPPSLFSQIYPY